jgi:hypothetical protein
MIEATNGEKTLALLIDRNNFLRKLRAYLVQKKSRNIAAGVNSLAPMASGLGAARSSLAEGTKEEEHATNFLTRVIQGAYSGSESVSNFNVENGDDDFVAILKNRY